MLGLERGTLGLGHDGVGSGQFRHKREKEGGVCFFLLNAE